MGYGYIDMHCDTLWRAYMSPEGERGMRDHPDWMVDFARMKRGEARAQFFAIFFPTQESFTCAQAPIPSDEEYFESCLSIFREETGRNSDIIAPARSATEIEANDRAGLMSAVLTVEDGRAVDGRMEVIDRYKEAGVVAMSLTWNSYNCFGAPNSTDQIIMGDGLTAFGREAVRHMQDIGIIVDVSHLSDGGFRDVAEICSKPFIASHSNCRALCDDPRNLTDAMIRTLADRGGAMGINFFSLFLEKGSSLSRIEAMVSHAAHEKQIGGADVIALGSDFDGIFGELELAGADQMQMLADALSGAGFTGTEIEKIFSGNVMRVMRETIG